VVDAEGRVQEAEDVPHPGRQGAQLREDDQGDHDQLPQGEDLERLCEDHEEQALAVIILRDANIYSRIVMNIIS
jgi:hypothetical protein